MSSLKEAALSYAARGWSVFPLVERDKIPAIKGGFKSATDDDDQIKQFWDYKPKCNIGIATGTVSRGLIVIDLDVDEARGEDGNETLWKWEKEHGELPETVTAITGSGGRHLYYKCNTNISCSVDNEKGVDIRGDGGYVVAPPSVHPSGGSYEWENDPSDYEIADADDNVYAFIRSIQGERKQGAKFRVPAKIGAGKRNDTLYKLACSRQSSGDDDEVILAYVSTINKMKCNPPLPDDEVEQIVLSALSHEKGSSESKLSKNTSISLMLKSNGSPQQTIENATRVLGTDPNLTGRVLYNEIAYSRVVSLPVPWDSGSGERPISDADYCGLAAYMERTYGLYNKNKTIDAVTNISMANRYNPLIDWLDSLVWDGVERVDTLLSCFLGAESSDYNSAVIRLFMNGAVSRAYNPGTKFDYMPVLVGKQGIGKSFFLRRLCRRSEWFCDNFNTVEGDAAAEKLRGMWIVELAELLATKRQKDVESIKAFITSTVDTIRPKYARETEQRRRMCVFAGTTNNPQFLTDSTGNRRFLPVECFGNAPLSLFSDDADHYFEQAWAEIVHAYKIEKPKLYLDIRTEQFAIQKQEDYLEDDIRVGLIQDYLRACGMDAKVCVAELCDRALGLDKREYYGKRSVSNEIHSIMQARIAGWKRCEKKVKTACYGPQFCYEREPEEGQKVDS